jgi:lipid-A-disaccharide synthase
MGFFEVLKHLGNILRNISFCKRDILEFKPDVVILIDYPGFNFRLFKFLKLHRFKTFYYISPQLWAWKKGRVKKVKEYVDRMFVIFPFEKEFYSRYGVDVDFVGHPLLDELQVSNDNISQKNTNTVALLPGSRKQEISYLLPEYLKVVDEFPEYRFVVTGLGSIGLEFYRNIIGSSKVELVFDNTYKTLVNSQAAIVTSGTATLETALFNVPEVICYKGSWISYFIINALIDKSIRFICIVNLICGRKIVEELIQRDVNKERLSTELRRILNLEGRNEILKGYELLHTKLGEGGASQRAAELMIGYLR